MYKSDKIIRFEVVTPERVVLKKEIIQVTIPTKAGEITVLPKHTPLVANISPGIIEIKDKDGRKDVMSVSGGFVEVLRNKIVILADTAERAEEIDIKRAEAARERAEELKKNMRHFDAERFTSINAYIAKELARTRAVRRWKALKNIKS